VKKTNCKNRNLCHKSISDRNFTNTNARVASGNLQPRPNSAVPTYCSTWNSLPDSLRDPALSLSCIFRCHLPTTHFFIRIVDEPYSARWIFLYKNAL